MKHPKMTTEQWRAAERINLWLRARRNAGQDSTVVVVGWMHPFAKCEGGLVYGLRIVVDDAMSPTDYSIQ